MNDPSTRPADGAAGIADTPCPKRVLFVCTGNSARSIMAEALMEALGGGAVVAASAGSHPTGRVHPLALAQIAQLPVDPRRYSSKSLDSVLASTPQPFDLVITVCDNAAGSCGGLPFDPARLHWGLSDPAALRDPAEAQRAFVACFADLRERISLLIAGLRRSPIPSAPPRHLERG